MITIIPSDTDVIEAARLAQCAHLHLITNGRSTVLSPVVPPGWHKLAVTVKEAPDGTPAVRAV